MRKPRAYNLMPMRPSLRGALKIASCAVLLLVVAAVGMILIFRFVNPPGSMLMVARKLEGITIRHQWVPIEKIAPVLVKTVVTSEDAAFCRHWGVDWNAIDLALAEAEKRGDGPRGASTIPMQTAKNLFLWQQRSYVRKAIEIPLAYAMSALWPKRRMIEVYLNIAEWGPGVFGAQAAARKHFRRSAAKLNAQQAAQLAAALPNPHVRNAGRPGPRTRRLASHIAGRVKREDTPLRCIYGN